MDIEEKLELLTRNAEEVVTRSELREILETTASPRAYWGFESSGLMHIGMGLVCGGKIKDFVKAGFKFIIFLADWHSWINNKLGGNMENIRMCGEYFKQCFKALGISEADVAYLWASDIAKEVGYWEKVIRIAKSNSLRRVWRALPIMGRAMDTQDVEAAAVYYPCMQAADIFQMELDVACAGIDQRKAHMLARDSAEKLGFRKPACVHTSLLTGLQRKRIAAVGTFDENADLNAKIAFKMSKSVPGSSILIHDPPEEIRSKVKGAFCPPKETRGNPVLEIARYVIIPEKGAIEVRRPRKEGGTATFTDFDALSQAYRKGSVHPLDLKESAAESLVDILSPVRREFETKPELLDKMKRIEITR